MGETLLYEDLNDDNKVYDTLLNVLHPRFVFSNIFCLQYYNRLNNITVMRNVLKLYLQPFELAQRHQLRLHSGGFNMLYRMVNFQNRMQQIYHGSSITR